MNCYRCGRPCARSFDLLRIGGKNVAVCKPSCPGAPVVIPHADRAERGVRRLHHDGCAASGASWGTVQPQGLVCNCNSAWSSVLPPPPCPYHSTSAPKVDQASWNLGPGEIFPQLPYIDHAPEPRRIARMRRQLSR